MKKPVCLLALLSFLLAACGSTPIFSITPTPEAITPTPTPRPTDTLVPTESVPNFYAGLAPTLEQFPLVDKADIPNIIDYLRSQPSFLTEGSPAPYIAPMVHSPSGEAHFSVDCNRNGLINCAPAASIQIAEQELDVHIIIWEIRNGDGSRGYLVNYKYDSYQFNGQQSYKWLVDHLNDKMSLKIITGVATDRQEVYSYMTSLFQQPGYMDANQQWIDTGNIPEQLENLIEPMYAS